MNALEPIPEPILESIVQVVEHGSNVDKNT